MAFSSTNIKTHSIGVTEPQLEEFEFDWEIKKFSTIPLNASVYSPIFEGGLCKWRLQMTSNLSSDHYVEICFKMAIIGSAPENSFVKYGLSITNYGSIIEPKSSAYFYNGQRNVECERIGENNTCFNKMDFADDTLRLKCKVKLYNPQLAKCVILPGSQMEVPASDKLIKDYTRVFQTKENADISINVEGNILLAHKTILSIRSTVFATMFDVKMKESAENVVQIDDFEVEDVKALLEFIYTGQTEAVQKNPEILIQLAEKYDLPDLKSACGVQLIQGITIENAIERLYLADRFKVANLKSYVEKFIYMNETELAKTEGFQELASSELFLKMCANIFFQE